MASKKIGRPPEPVPAVMVERIVEWISGGETLRDFCRQPDTPAWRTVYDWRRKDEVFATRFAQARELGFDAIAEECLSIADDGTNDWMVRESKDGKSTFEVANTEHIQRSKLRIETRIKLLAKWDPARYGEKLALGGDASAPPIRLSDTERVAKMAALVAVVEKRIQSEGLVAARDGEENAGPVDGQG